MSIQGGEGRRPPGEHLADPNWLYPCRRIPTAIRVEAGLGVEPRVEHEFTDRLPLLEEHEAEGGDERPAEEQTREPQQRRLLGR